MQFWLKPTKRWDYYLWQTWRLIRKSLFVWIKQFLLWFHITFLANNYKHHLWVAINFGLFKPSGNIIKALSIGNIVDEDGASCWSIVSASDGLEWFLSSLNSQNITVSHICSFIVFYPTVIILAPNYTPMVTSCFCRNRWSMNWRRRQDLPTPIKIRDGLPVSPMMMNLNI